MPASKVVSLGHGALSGGTPRVPADERRARIWRWAAIPGRQAKSRRPLEHVFELLPAIEGALQRQVAGTLSGGEQQMLAMGRAMMSKPKLLMLDEPSMGLAPLLVEQIFDIILALNKAGTTILLVEQNAQMALSIADRAYVLETGNIFKEGSADMLMHDDAVRKAYLG